MGGTRTKAKHLRQASVGTSRLTRSMIPSDLDLRGVHHHAERARDRRRRQVVRKLCADDTAVAVEVDDLAPHDAVCVDVFQASQCKNTRVKKTVWVLDKEG